MKRFLLITMIALLTLVFVGCSCEFTALYYDVTYCSADGLEIATVKVKRNASLTLPSETELLDWITSNQKLIDLGIGYPAYYKYDGLWYKEDGARINLNDYKRVRSDIKLRGTVVLGEPYELNVTFNAGQHGMLMDGASKVKTFTKTVNYGEKATPPTVIADENYIFSGWDCGADALNSVKSSLTATALYTHTGELEVTFNAGQHGMLRSGDAKVSTLIMTVEHGSSVTPPEVIPDDDYEFSGWDVSSGKFNNVTESFTATAQYVYVGEVAVTFNAGEHGKIDNDGEMVTSLTLRIEYGGNVTPPAIVADDEYEFIGWSCAENKFINVTESFTATALYRPVNMVTVTFNAGEGGYFDELETIIYITVEIGGSVTPPDVFALEGYTFIGWETDGFSFDDVTDDFTATAMYDVQTFIVTFIAGEYGTFADGEPEAQITVNYGASLTAEMIPELFAVNEAYEFEAWDFLLGQPIYEDTVITATWVIKTYVVTFFVGSTFFNMQFVEYGDDAIDPGIPRLENHTFTGWDKEYTNVKSDLSIYAQFAPALIIHEFYYESIAPENLIERAEYVYGTDSTDLITRMRAAAEAYALTLGEGFYFNGWTYQIEYNYEDGDNGNLVSISYRWVATYSDKINYAITFWFEDAEGNLVRLGEIYIVPKGYIFSESFIMGLLEQLFGENDFELEFVDSNGNDVSHVFDEDGDGVNKTMDIIIRIKI